MVELASFLVVATAVVVAVVGWVAQPLWRGVIGESHVDQRTVALLSQREAILAGLRDLDSDHAAGRISDADYERLRAEELAEGASVLEALDRLADDRTASWGALTRQIESEVAALRGGGPGGES